MSAAPALSLPGSLPAHATVIGFDFGERRIGVATGNTTIGVATPLTIIHATSNADRLKAVGELVAQWQPHVFVVGQPAHADGRPHEIAHLAKRFGNRLTEHFKRPVAYVDETLSSSEASAQLAERGVVGRAQKPHLDAEAAAIILQSWLDSIRQPGAAHAA
ncbi:MAG: Holliday junction resolvase RuvX [Burkholderiales bacterium]|nr:Holliday junction resolvase RuvX [Nitrosomonadaceae bacterium]